MTNKKGFTLIEAVLSIALIGIGLVGVLYPFHGAVSSALKADQTTVGLNLARDTLEQIIARRDCNEASCGYASTLSAVTSGIYDLNPVPGFAGFTIDASAVEVDPDDDDTVDDFGATAADYQSGSGVARVTVVVRWNNGNDRVQLVTLMANYL